MRIFESYGRFFAAFGLKKTIQYCHSHNSGLANKRSALDRVHPVAFFDTFKTLSSKDTHRNHKGRDLFSKQLLN